MAPVLMASITLDLKVSIEGAHAKFTSKILHIRIVGGTGVGHVGLLWTGMSIYDDFSKHGLDAHLGWVGSCWRSEIFDFKIGVISFF